MIDVSDGLGVDAGRIGAASGLATQLRFGELPTLDGVSDVEAWLGIETGMLALNGGDDYELAIAISPDRVPAVAEAVAPTTLSVVGEFVEGQGVATTRADGSTVDASSIGWDHFKEDA